jgi:pyruvate,orthophosphate dikinase
MYSDVVLGLGHHHFEEILDDHKDRNGYTLDTDLTADDWVDLVVRAHARTFIAAEHPSQLRYG